MPNTVTPKSVLDQLSQIGGYVGLAIQVGEVLVPIGKAVVTKIKSALTSVDSEDYQLLVAGDQAELLAVDKLSNDDLTAINAELVRLGKPPLTTG
jgi:hypothetical protein